MSLVEIPRSRTRCLRQAPITPFDPVLHSRDLPRLRIARTPLSAPLGVTVNESAILGADVIVLKDLKPWMIVMENTARD